MQEFFRDWVNRFQASTSLRAYSQRIEPLQQRAFDLAIQRWRENMSLDETCIDEAEQIHRELEAIAQTLHNSSIQVPHSVADQISEALLDCNYALHPSSVMSLRLHHYIESQAASE